MHKSGPQKKQCVQKSCKCIKNLFQTSVNETLSVPWTVHQIERKQFGSVCVQKTKAGFLWHLRVKQILQNGLAL